MAAEKKVGAGFGVILTRRGKILLGKRHPNPAKADSAFKSAGEWCLPGGKLEWGETLEDGAVREVKEETGLVIQNPKVVSLQNCRNEFAHFVTIGLITSRWRGIPRVMEPDEITEWRWFDLNHLPYPRYFPSFAVIANYLEKRFYKKGR